MKLAGLLMLPAGWLIVLTAIVLLPPQPIRAVFVLAGVAVEALGLGLVTRAHLPALEEEERNGGRR